MLMYKGRATKLLGRSVPTGGCFIPSLREMIRPFFAFLQGF